MQSLSDTFTIRARWRVGEWRCQIDTIDFSENTDSCILIQLCLATYVFVIIPHAFVPVIHWLLGPFLHLSDNFNQQQLSVVLRVQKRQSEFSQQALAHSCLLLAGNTPPGTLSPIQMQTPGDFTQPKTRLVEYKHNLLPCESVAST